MQNIPHKFLSRLFIYAHYTTFRKPISVCGWLQLLEVCNEPRVQKVYLFLKTETETENSMLAPTGDGLQISQRWMRGICVSSKWAMHGPCAERDVGRWYLIRSITVWKNTGVEVGPERALLWWGPVQEKLWEKNDDHLLLLLLLALYCHLLDRGANCNELQTILWFLKLWPSIGGNPHCFIIKKELVVYAGISKDFIKVEVWPLERYIPHNLTSSPVVRLGDP